MTMDTKEPEIWSHTHGQEDRPSDTVYNSWDGDRVGDGDQRWYLSFLDGVENPSKTIDNYKNGGGQGDGERTADRCRILGS